MSFLADAHVHFYELFDKSDFFESAVRNFRSGSEELGLSADTTGVLLFAERADDHFFDSCQRSVTRPLLEHWTLRETAEDCSLIAFREERPQLILIAGRQIATQEGLEVLALGCSHLYSDGEPLRETIDRAREAGALAVLPWGFGKWMLRRGSLAKAVLKSACPGELFLGDNGNRPRIAHQPRLFSLARTRGILILPGSDPLPYPKHATRAGSYGLEIQAPVDFHTPAAQIKSYLKSQVEQPRVYGLLAGFLSFCRWQTSLQIRKRRGNL